MRIPRHTIATLLCLLPSLTFAATLGDWPQWRGPNRDGKSADTGLKHTWGEEGPPLVYRVKGLGIGFASVSMADGRIFTMGDRDGQQCLIALDQETGKELWATKVGGGFTNTGYHGARCTPTIDDGRVYALGTSSDLVCCEAATGKLIWVKNFAADFGGKMMSNWAFSESPLVDGDKLVCTPGGVDATIVALDKKTGRTLWTTAIAPIGELGKDGAAYSSIMITHGGGHKQYVQLLGRGLVGIDAESGKFLWGYNKIANKTANIPTPIIKDDYVFCSTGYQTGAALLRLKAKGDGIEAEEVWFQTGKDLQNHHGGMVLVGDYLYGGHGHNKGFPVCVEFKTGKIQWDGGRGPGSGSAAVVYADGQMYFRYQDGVMALVDASPKGYKLQGQFKIPDSTKPSWPHPVVVGGRLYLREQDELFVYDLRKS